MTLKQKLFIKKYLEKNGNGTKAALEVYDTKNPNVAHTIASENLQKPAVKREIELALERVGLNDEYIVELLKESTVAGLGVKASNADSLRGIDMMLKLKGAYPTITQKTAHLRIERKETLAKMDYQVLEQELKELNKKANQLIKDLTPITPL